jgi:hypothetical protein
MVEPDPGDFLASWDVSAANAAEPSQIVHLRFVSTTCWRAPIQFLKGFFPPGLRPYGFKSLTHLDFSSEVTVICPSTSSAGFDPRGGPEGFGAVSRRLP